MPKKLFSLAQVWSLHFAEYFALLATAEPTIGPYNWYSGRLMHMSRTGILQRFLTKCSTLLRPILPLPTGYLQSLRLLALIATQKQTVNES